VPRPRAILASAFGREQVRAGAVAQESREHALARTLSQSGHGAMAWVKAYIWNGMEINPPHAQLAVRRSLDNVRTLALPIPRQPQSPPRQRPHQRHAPRHHLSTLGWPALATMTWPPTT
jgi:hypothetical protein